MAFKRVSGYLQFAKRELSDRSTSLSARLEALWRCKHSLSLAAMHPEVRRARTYIPVTLFERRQKHYSWRTKNFFSNKLHQYFWLQRYFPEQAPPTRYYAGLQELVPIASASETLSLSDLPGVVRERGGVFVKPSDGGHGHGAAHLAPRGNVIELNGSPIQDEELVRFAAENWFGYLICDIIQNSAWSGKFYGRTLNTLRILTGVHRDTQAPAILSAIFKVGCDATFPTDNWLRGLGGITAKVDLETGKLGQAVFLPDAKRGGRRVLAAHPDSGVAIEGETVPDWLAIKRLTLEIATKSLFLGHIGWDIALTPSGIVVVEGNGSPGIDIHEAHESLLATEEQRACFAGMKIFPRGRKN